jgi:hypothetical protein
VECGIRPFTKLEDHRGLQIWRAGLGGRAENRASERIFETWFSGMSKPDQKV